MSFLKRLGRLFGVEEVAEVDPVSNFKKDRAWRAQRNKTIRQRFKNGLSVKALAKEYGYAESTIRRAIKKRGG